MNSDLAFLSGMYIKRQCPEIVTQSMNLALHNLAQNLATWSSHASTGTTGNIGRPNCTSGYL